MPYDCPYNNYIYKVINLQCTPGGITWYWGTRVPFSLTRQASSVVACVSLLEAGGHRPGAHFPPLSLWGSDASSHSWHKNKRLSFCSPLLALIRKFWERTHYHYLEEPNSVLKSFILFKSVLPKLHFPVAI